MTVAGSTRMSALERRAIIARLAEEQERISVAELAERFGITDVSIRRDLALLEDAGKLRRVHGGAVAGRSAMRDRPYVQRARENRDAKESIGRAAATLISPGDVLIFDSGSTVAQVAANVAPALRRSGAITVVTNSLPVIEQVAMWDSPHLVCVGGLYLPDHEALVGPQAIEQLRELSADIAFIGCDGWTSEGGLMTPHVLVAQMGAEIVARGQRVVAVADSSKIGRRGFTPIVPISSVDVLVTDAAADPTEVARARAAGVEIVVA